MNRYAFGGSIDLKHAAIAVMRSARERGAIREHTTQYWDAEPRCGCPIGVLLESGDHWTIEHLWHLPSSVAYAVDRLFVQLEGDDAILLAERVLNAIEPGADVRRVSVASPGEGRTWADVADDYVAALRKASGLVERDAHTLAAEHPVDHTINTAHDFSQRPSSEPACREMTRADFDEPV